MRVYFSPSPQLWSPPIGLLVTFAAAISGAAAEVCLQPRVDLVTLDEGNSGGYQADLSIVSSPSNDASYFVARSRSGLFEIQNNQHHQQEGSPRLDLQRIGGLIGSAIRGVDLALNSETGKVILAVESEGGTVATLQYNPDKNSDNSKSNATSSLEFLHWITPSRSESVDGMVNSWGEGVALTGDGSLLAACTVLEDAIGIFDITTGIDPKNTSLLPTQRIPIGPDKASRLAFSADGNVLVAAIDSCDGDNPDEARLLIFRQGKTQQQEWTQELNITGTSLECANRGYTGISIATNMDGSLVAIGSFNSLQKDPAVSVFAYNVDGDPKWAVRDVIGTNVWRSVYVTLSEEGDMLAIGTPFWIPADVDLTYSDRVTLYQYTTNAEWRVIGRIKGTEDNPIIGNSVALNEDASVLVVGSGSQMARIYDIVNGTCETDDNENITIIPQFPAKSTTICEDEVITINVTNPVFHLSLS